MTGGGGLGTPRVETAELISQGKWLLRRLTTNPHLVFTDGSHFVTLS